MQQSWRAMADILQSKEETDIQRYNEIGLQNIVTKPSVKRSDNLEFLTNSANSSS